MFESLEEKIEQSEATHLSSKQKVLRYVGLAAITGIVFSAVFMAVRLLG